MRSIFTASGQGVALASQRVGVAGLLIPPDNILVGGLDEQQLIVQVHLPQAVERLEQLVKGLPAANVRSPAPRGCLSPSRPRPMHSPAKLVMRATGMLSTQ